MRLNAEKKLLENPDDNLTWLLVQRDLAIANREEAFAADDKAKANRHAVSADRIFKASEELRHLRGRMAVAEKLLTSRLIVSLGKATKPAWKPTHKHYKGKLYRVTGIRADANGQELVDGVEYDDAMGNRYYLHRSRWDSLLDSGKPRYQVILNND